MVNGLNDLGIPNFDSSTALAGGVSTLGPNLPESTVRQVLQVFNDALVHSWQVPLVLSCVSIIGALFVEHRPIKGKKVKSIDKETTA